MENLYNLKTLDIQQIEAHRGYGLKLITDEKNKMRIISNTKALLERKQIEVREAHKKVEVLKKLKEEGFGIFAGCLDAKQYIFDEDLAKKSVICIGNEAHGISDELINIGVNKTKIPIPGKAESLNAGVAGAIMMFEVVRQRKMYD